MWHATTVLNYQQKAKEISITEVDRRTQKTTASITPILMYGYTAVTNKRYYK